MRAVTLVFLFVVSLSVVAALDGFSSPRDAEFYSGSLVVSDTTVYSTGYVSDDGQNWDSFAFSGQTRGDWVIGQAIADVRTDANYYAFYTCTWRSGWNCSNTWQVYDTRGTSDYVPKDSLQGDFEALQALYASTQGQTIPTLDSVDELESDDVRNIEYPFMYMIDGEIHYLEIVRTKDFTDSTEPGWVNAGSPWKNTTGWDDMTPETMGEAAGITVDENGRVIGIDMQKVTLKYENERYYTTGNTLVGTLPEEINNLHKLQYFNIKQNFFVGEIPSISNWNQAVRLSFAGQPWELDIESRHQWHENDHNTGPQELVEGARLSGVGKKITTTNRFRTDIPEEIDGFENLELFELRHQYLTGELPAWSNLPSIKGIFIDDARYAGSDSISGSIPDSWGELTTTRYLKMQAYHTSSRYSGTIPQGMQENWQELNNIDIGGHEFTGPIPTFPNARDKRYVILSFNKFTGGFPSEYFNGDNARMTKWQIGSNQLSGELPSTITPPSYPIARSNYAIDAPGIGRNAFTGPLPEWYQSMLGMQTFYIVGNAFEGPFPSSVAEQDNLKTFYISDNNFSGPLPNITWGDRRKGWIYMGGNNFTGEIPASWISLFQSDAGQWHNDIHVFNMAGNELSGRIPDWLLNLEVHRGFGLNNNRYTFRDIGPVYDAYRAHMGDNFQVDNQKPFGMSQTMSASVGDLVELDLSEFAYENNVYQWTKDGQDISGATSSVLTIDSVQSSDASMYILEVTNSDMSALGVHESKPITLHVS